MSRRNHSRAKRRPKSESVGALPDACICRARPSELRGYVDCLASDSGNCPYALGHEGGSLCLHPQSDAIAAQANGKPGGRLPRLTLKAKSDHSLSALTFRQATAKDYPLLGGLNYQLIHDLGLPHLMTMREMGMRMRKLLASDHRATLFELHGKVVAYALYRESPKGIYLRQFLVVRSHRRKGIARRAIGVLRAQVWPKSKGLTVEVLVSNKPALEFWRNVGFRDLSLKLEIPPLRQRPSRRNVPLLSVTPRPAA